MLVGLSTAEGFSHRVDVASCWLYSSSTDLRNLQLLITCVQNLTLQDFSSPSRRNWTSGTGIDVVKQTGEGRDKISFS